MTLELMRMHWPVKECGWSSLHRDFQLAFQHINDFHCPVPMAGYITARIHRGEETHLSGLRYLNDLIQYISFGSAMSIPPFHHYIIAVQPTRREKSTYYVGSIRPVSCMDPVILYI